LNGRPQRFPAAGRVESDRAENIPLDPLTERYYYLMDNPESTFGGSGRIKGWMKTF